MKRLTEAQLHDLFSDYKIGKRFLKTLRYPAETLQWEDREFITVSNKQANEGVLMSEVLGHEAVRYELRKRSAKSSGRIEAIICDICMTWQSGPRSATITFEKQKGTATFLVCADLACCDHVRDNTEAAAISRSQLREHLSIEDRIERLRKNLVRILT